MTLFNICTRRNYQEDGETKTKWYRVGFLKISPTGKMYLRLFQQPETPFYVFDSETKTPVGELEDNTQEE